MNYRVSVDFFVATEAALRKKYGPIRISQGELNRWIQLLGQVEAEYRHLTQGRKKGSGQ